MATAPLTIPQQVRAAREARGLSQTALAEATGQRKATIVDVEAGRNVTWETLARIAAGLDEDLVIHADAPLPEVRPNMRGRQKKKR